MSEEDREQFLSRFEGNRNCELEDMIHMDIEVEEEKSLLGFCVMGGIFSEGIDLKNDSLIGAVIVGTGLPQVCNERDVYKRQVLRLHNTQPKDRRAYTPLTGILAERQEKGDGTRQRRRAAGTRTAAPMFFIYTLFSTDI